jgi:hypothetical protein
MKFPLILLLANALLAQEAPKPAPTPPPPGAAAAVMDHKSVMLIDPKARSNDYAQAFDFLRKDRPTLKILIRTTQALFMGVTEVAASSSGTLLTIKTLSNQGIKTHFVPIEQIVEINYSP